MGPYSCDECVVMRMLVPPAVSLWSFLQVVRLANDATAVWSKLFVLSFYFFFSELLMLAGSDMQKQKPRGSFLCKRTY